MIIFSARFDPKYSTTADDLNLLARVVRSLLDRTESLCTAELKRIKVQIQEKPQSPQGKMDQPAKPIVAVIWHEHATCRSLLRSAIIILFPGRISKAA